MMGTHWWLIWSERSGDTAEIEDKGVRGNKTGGVRWEGMLEVYGKWVYKMGLMLGMMSMRDDEDGTRGFE